MTETKMLPEPEGGQSNDWLLPVLVFFGAFIIMLLLMLGNSGQPDAELSLADKSESVAEPGSARVAFLEPKDNQTVGAVFPVILQAVNLTVEPSGEVNEGAGHFHVLIDAPFIEAGDVIPSDESHLHMGDGSVVKEITLEPGTYTLRLQFANGEHVAQDGDAYRDEITVIVGAE